MLAYPFFEFDKSDWSETGLSDLGSGSSSSSNSSSSLISSSAGTIGNGPLGM